MWFRKAYFITLTLAVRRNPHLSQQAPVFAERRDDISEEEASVARRHRALLHDCVEQLVVSRIPSFSAETVDDSAENVDEAQTEDIYGNLVFTTNSRLFTSCSFWLIFPRNSVFLEFWEGQLWLGLMQIPKKRPTMSLLQNWICLGQTMPPSAAFGVTQDIWKHKRQDKQGHSSFHSWVVAVQICTNTEQPLFPCCKQEDFNSTKVKRGNSQQISTDPNMDWIKE